MNDARLHTDGRRIEVDEVFPHAPALIWRTLTTGALIGRWLMVPTGFEAVVGTPFTFQTRPAGAWDGVIRCTVLDVVPERRLVYAWRSGDDGNVGYGSPLDTVVTWTLTPVDGGTRLRLVHAGFVAPVNDTAFESMRGAWPSVVHHVGDIAGEVAAPAGAPLH